MKKGYRDYLVLLGFQLALLLYHTHSFLSTQNFAGRDLIGAYSMVENFGLGWSTDWFLGFPMFKFYPPGFFAATKALGAFLGDLLAFKLIVYSSLLAVPLTAYYAFSSMYDRRTGIVAGFVGIFLTFMREPFSLVYQTLQVGLVAQAFALPFLLLFIGTLWKEDRGSAYLSALLLALTTLSHPFLGALALAYTGIYFAAERNFFRSFMASTGLAMTGWWIIPVIEKSWYIQLYTGHTGKLANLPWLFLPFLLLDRGKKTLTLISLGFLLVLLGSFKLFPMQYYRAFIYGQLLLALAAVPGVTETTRKLSGRLSHQTLIHIVGLSMLVAALTVNVTPTWESTTSLENVTPESGKVIVETSKPELYESYVPVQRIPLESNASVVNGLYADSSISSPYLLGLEKSIADDPVPNPIAVDANLSQDQIRERMAYLDIEHALVRTRYARERLYFMKVTGRNDDFTLLSWEPEYNRSIDEPEVFKGSHEEWKELNRRIFRGELETGTVYHHRETGIEPEAVKISHESIRPDAEKQAVFGLRLR